ncbi:MAG: GNAT family N-acetyltransferase [Chloroflexi bacterium]|nr:GNAT family N-acetyltransferase [Chloroflexota bacterium]
MKVAPATDADRSAWDAYVAGVPKNLPMNRYAWKEILERAYGVTTLFLAAEDEEGQVCGVLPTYMTTGFNGTEGVFSLKGGLVANNDEAAEALVSCLESFCRERKVSSCLLTSGFVEKQTPYRPMTRNTMIMDIMASEEAQWDALRSKTRNMLRKAVAGGLVAERGFHNLDGFYDIYASLMLDKKITLLSKGLFRALAHSLGPDAELISAKKDSRIVGGVLVLFGSEVATYPWQASAPDAHDLAPNQFLIWEALKSCRERGISMLDMGECTVGGSVYLFKKNFGGRPLNVHYYESPPGYWANGRKSALANGRRLTGVVAARIASRLANNSPAWARRRVGPWIKAKGRIV